MANQIRNSISTNDLCAVVVTYYPDPDIQTRIHNLLAQFSKIIIVDNGTSDPIYRRFLTFYKNNNQVDLIRNQNNLGIATALNQGVAHAVQKGFSWIALFDQDSFLDKSAIIGIQNAIEGYPYADKLMLIACKIVSKNNNASHKMGFDSLNLWEDTEQVITSGSFLSAKAFQLIGKFNEQLFIDYVDIEYCLRIKRLGYKIITALNAKLYHEVGNQNEIKLFNRNIHPTNHPPVRRYYQFRNSFLLYRAYYKIDLLWIKQNTLVLLKVIISIVLFESDKRVKLQHIAKGIYHGILGCAGKYGEKTFTHIYYPLK